MQFGHQFLFRYDGGVQHARQHVGRMCHAEQMPSGHALGQSETDFQLPLFIGAQSGHIEGRFLEVGAQAAVHVHLFSIICLLNFHSRTCKCGIDAITVETSNPSRDYHFLYGVIRAGSGLLGRCF